jgi:hypothetical protein
LDKHAPNSTLSWNNLVGTTYWTVRLTQFQIDDQVIPIQSTKAILETSTSYTVIPKKDFANLIEYWSDKMVCGLDKVQSLYYC